MAAALPSQQRKNGLDDAKSTEEIRVELGSDVSLVGLFAAPTSA
jgi:hypothetical protein